jgi:glycosyltransferase involved in cell wall biosynthesis
VIDPPKLKALPYDASLLEHLRSTRQVNILFVSRIARNKRQDRLMQVLDYYYREIDPQVHLWLVGNENSDPAYRAELEELRLSLASRDHIHFTGKISDAQIYACYRAADVFLSASEHEGFGVPLTEAMAFDVPIIAYAATAVPETMGEAGVLIQDWDSLHIAGLIHNLHKNPAHKEQMFEQQRQNLRRFTSDEAKARLRAVINFLQSGETSPLMEEIQPGVE